MTDFRTSTTTLEIDAPQLRATQLVARPGALPTVTFPMLGQQSPDVARLREYLCAPADFFDVPMPTLDDLVTAVTTRAASFGPGLTAVTITIADANGAPQILMSTSAVPQDGLDVVRVAGGAAMAPPHSSSDPWWRRMAARTTSRGEVDQLERWLGGHGFADAVTDGVPLLGALVVRTADTLVGVENPEPTSVLDSLERCGAVAVLARVAALPGGVVRAWWISPRFQTHAVSALDGTDLGTEPEAAPPFWRLP